MKNNRYIAFVTGVVLLSSCNFLDLTPNVICSDTFYNTEDEVKYGLVGIYGVMGREQFYGNYYSAMYANNDDLCYFNRDLGTNFLQYNRHDAGTVQIYDIWTTIYQGIRNANAFMEAVPKTQFDKDGKYYNEARFLRAYYHFILAQSWGDVPLKTSATKTPDDVMCAATSQFEVLTWVAQEMTECLALADEDVAKQPSRVTKTTVQGILARVYLFMVGESVKGGDKSDFLAKARDYAKAVIDSGMHQLNPDYSQVFINMISDQYDTQYHESMWEAEFMGDRSSAESWSNGRIGDVLGLQSGDSSSSQFSAFACNYAYGQYDGSLKLWDLYWQTDRTDEQQALSTITDKRQEWNMPPYNYAGNANQPPYGQSTGKCVAGIDKTPYVYKSVTTTNDPTAAQAIRNCGKFRREVIYEGQKTSKSLYTTINFPILRYSDVLLMYAEASNELSGPTQEAYDCIKAVRDRAGIATKEIGAYDKESFREFVRNERGRELCFESIRRFDLIRWGEYVKCMNEYTQWAADSRWSENVKSTRAANIGGAVSERHVLLPVPSIELGVNKELKQNEQWSK